MGQMDGIEVGATYTKGRTQRTVLGFEPPYFVVYRNKKGVVYEMSDRFKKWLKNAEKVEPKEAATHA